MDEVHDEVCRHLPHVSLATVYRNLEMMSAGGLIDRIDQSGSPMRFDCHIHPHYHIRCQLCGRVDDVPIDPLPDLAYDLQKKVDYQVLGFRLEFVGLCPRCRSEQTQLKDGKTAR